jgi:hypothetical protein
MLMLPSLSDRARENGGDKEKDTEKMKILFVDLYLELKIVNK